jgi:2-dehydropantoate 2-reductase
MQKQKRGIIMKIKNAALIGMGAIGTVYGSLLHRKYGSDFAVIAGGARGEKLQNDGVIINKNTFYPRVISPEEENFGADLIVVCVKNYQLDDAIADIGHFVRAETVILPLLNGVTARDRILAAFPNNTVFYGLSIFIDALRTADGVTNTVNGVIQFGKAENTVPAPEVSAVKDYLAAAGIEVQTCPDMIRAVWKKWMLNVGCNQISAVTGAPYGKLVGLETNRTLFHEAMTEVVTLAEASGIDLTQKDVQAFETMMATFSPLGKTSMLQDVEAKRKTEVDYFAGTVVEFGKKLNIPTPVNHVLHCIIKSKEQLY